MNKKDIELLKNQLLEEKESLESQLGEFAREGKRQKDDYESQFPDYGDKDEENAAEVAVFSNQLAMEGNLEHKLRKTNRALEKIKKGAYGPCENCGQEMSMRRLEAFPSAVLCMKCIKEGVDADKFL